MSGFLFHDSTLVCDDVPIPAIADAIGTPVYVYSAGLIRDRYREIDGAFSSHPHALHYAFKANSTLAIVRLLRGLGSQVDANSGGEIDVALRAGFIPPQVVFTGVGKTRDELERAVALGVKAINAESGGELERIDEVARALGTRARVALRVNPDIDARSHPKITTGLLTSKFGVPIDEAAAICRAAAAREGLEVVGLHVHVGSQIVTLDPLRHAARTIAALARELADAGIPIEHLDLGGGLGISYNGGPVPSASEYAQALLEEIGRSRLTLLLEPGRFVIGPAGALVTRVVDVKTQPGGKRFVVTDAGMTELLRPALYGAYHRIEPVVRRDEPDALCDVVGPLCETSDTLGADRRLPLPRVGDLLAVADAGAYGSVMASNYNRRPLPAEVLVEAGGVPSAAAALRAPGAWRLIRRRQTIDDLVALEE